MNPERWHRIKHLFDQALALEPSQRTPFLDRSCDEDPQLRRELDSLLDSHDRAGTNFLNTPPNLETVTLPVPPSHRGRRIGVYEIVEQIGHGGMGEVYRAVRADGQYKKEVAVKLVRGGYDTTSVLERFRNERQILASLDHPNIARLLDGGTTVDSIPFLVMELIEGKPIDRYCDELELSITDRLRLFRQVCLAVHYAHQHLIIHRDLKPSNVLVTEAGEPKLLDFGIAKIVTPINEAETTLMTRAMTPEYASPEQIRGEPITTASDIYSLGVVLYRLLTGRSPYPGDTRTPHKLAQAVCDTEPGRPSTVVAKLRTSVGEPEVDLKRIGGTREGSPAKLQRRLSGDLDDITMMALRKEPARRYTSAEQFADDIRRHLEGLPVLAAKGSWTYRAEKFVKRHKLGISAAALVALAIIGGVAATVREARIAQANARRAERRFNDVRHLANSLTFDVDKSIAALPNSTPARKLLVDNALQYLDALSQEAKGDISLQREAADAYVKLADIQGNPFVPNLGDTNAAIASYRKSLAISESVAAADPTNRADQIRVAFAHEMIGEIVLIAEGNPQAAMAEEMKAIAILEPLYKSDPHDLLVLSRLGGAYDSTGDIQSGNGNSANFGDVNLALDYRRKSLDCAEREFRELPNDPNARRGLAASYMKLGRDLVKIGDRNAGLDSFRKALELLTPTPNSSPSRTASVIYQDVANTYMMNGDAKSALLNYRNLIEIDRKLLAQDAKNATARIDLAYGTAFLGIGIAESGDVKQGLASLQESMDLLQKEIDANPGKSFLQRYLGLAHVFRGQVLFKLGNYDAALRDFKATAAIHEKICAANPNDIDARVALAAANGKVADVLAIQKQSAEAVALYRKTLAVVEPLAHSPHPMLQAQYTAADAYTGLGAALVKQAQSGKPAPQDDTLKQACSWSQQAVAEWQRVPNPGKYGPSGFETAGPSRAAQELASCEASLKKHQNGSGKR